ncbi:MAG: hypothetical protein ABI851_13180 [Saprospiraceae bacterium]
MKSLYILFLIFAACNSQQKYKMHFANGIFIPTKIDWNDGNFKTIYVYNDSSFILINSTQKLIRDSIYFEAEPGYSLYKCVVKENHNKTIVVSEKLYSFISSPFKENLLDTLDVEVNNNIIIIDRQKFQLTNKYTCKSAETIKGLVSNYPED